MIFATAFPELYQRLLEESRESRCTLASLERRSLPMSVVRAVAGTMARWKIPSRLYKLLQQSALSYTEIATLTEPLRSKLERLRFAELIGQLAIGRFEPWDEIDLPPPETMCRLRAEDIRGVLDKVRTLAQVKGPGRSWDSSDAPELRYFKLTVEPCDLLAIILEASEANVVHIQRDQACEAQGSIVNCLDVSPERFSWFLEDAIPHSGRTIVSRGPIPANCESWGRLIQLPTTFKSLFDAATASTASSHWK
jgi:hypothetical protein